LPKQGSRADARAQEGGVDPALIDEYQRILDYLSLASEAWQQNAISILEITAQVSLHRRQRDVLRWIDGACESPIEKALAAEFIDLDIRVVERNHLRLAEGAPVCSLALAERMARIASRNIDGSPMHWSGKPGWWGLVCPQIQLGNYRVDFLVIASFCGLPAPRPMLRFVVECDGHDYHERTKEQAAYDRKRDREIQAMGLPVLRFTGSQIHRGAFACAEEIRRFVGVWADPIAAAAGRWDGEEKIWREENVDG
jgi:very-short-patch-repair endonuclease